MMLGYLIPEMNEVVFRPIVQTEASIKRTDPQIILRVFKKTQDKIAADACAVVFILPVDLHGVAIVTMQTILRADPHKALMIFDNSPDVPVPQPLFLRDMVKGNDLPRGRQDCHAANKKE